jgi:putative transposase
MTDDDVRNACHLYGARRVYEAAYARMFGYDRPHSSIGRIPPARFAALHRQRAGDARQSPEVS